MQHYLSQSNTIVLAWDINPLKISSSMLAPRSQLFCREVDFGSEQSIREAVRGMKHELLSIGNNDRKLDLIIHSAGIRGLVPEVVQQQPENVAAAETVQSMNNETMLRTYQINTLGTFNLIQQLAKHDLYRPQAQSPQSSDKITDFLARRNLVGPQVQSSERITKFVIMTSRMGSMSYNSTGAGYAYRASKAALNAIIKSFSIDLPHICFALVHPGRVETGLTVCREEGAIEVGESVGDMLKLMDSPGLGETGKVRYMDRFGKDIGW